MGALRWESGGGSFTRTLKNMYKKALEPGVFLNKVPVGDHGDAPFSGFCEKMKFCFISTRCSLRDPRVLQTGALETGNYPHRVPMGNLQGVRLPGSLRNSNIWVSLFGV